MEHRVNRTGVLDPSPTLSLPQRKARHELRSARPDGPSLKPSADCRLIEADEQPLAELLNGRKPVSADAQWRTTDRKPNIFYITVRCGRRGLKSREAVKAGHLAQAMNDH